MPYNHVLLMHSRATTTLLLSSALACAKQARERQRRLADREAKCSAVEEAGSRLGSQRKDLQGQERELQEKERAVEKLMAAADRSRSEAEALLASHKVHHHMHVGNLRKIRIIMKQDQSAAYKMLLWQYYGKQQWNHVEDWQRLNPPDILLEVWQVMQHDLSSIATP